MKKFGIDLGSASIGWVITEDGKIIKKGVVTFDTGMSKGQSGGYTSPTRERREARSKRNLIRARKYRKWELLKILIDLDFVPLEQYEFEIWSKYIKGRIRKFPENEKFLKWLACDFSYLKIWSDYKNPYELRVTALENKLSNHEFGRALYHLVQRRGYKDIGETDKETENQIARRGESGFQMALEEHKVISKALKFEFLDKNLRARNQYPYRDEYREELVLICKAQGYDISKDKNGNYYNKLVEKLWKAIIWQRPLRTQKGNIGKCTLEPKKLRCPISHPIFEIFRAWQFINTIKYHNEKNEKETLSSVFQKQLFEWVLTKDKNFKFEEIRTFLDKKFGKPEKYNYPIDKDGKYDTSVSGMPVCKGLITLFGDKAKQALYDIEQNNIGNCKENGGFGIAPKIIGQYSIYDLWHAIFSFDEQYLDKIAIEKFNILNVTRKRKGQDISVSPLVEFKSKFAQGYSDLSIKAMCKIIPFLKAGYLYNEAVVLAKMPELLGENWENKKNRILTSAEESNKIYEWNKLIIGITNNQIDKYKADKYFAVNDYTYILQISDLSAIEKSCQSYFGEKSWNDRIDKNEIIESAAEQYQKFYYDEKRSYREMPTLTDIFQKKLKENGIEINGKALYHHSDIENRYLKKCKIDPNTEKRILPTKKNKFDFEVEVLPDVIIDSIKNPMFNKAMSILRRLVNELIINGDLETDTEIVVEVARELNDNNRRVAIERYQNERKNNRAKYREFLEEFKEKENKNINVEESIPTFELWTEQAFEETEDENKKKATNLNRIEILKEKHAVKRYELWMEQKGQCMYTGKMISFSDLFSTKIDIEHTIPRSLLPDNTMANQTVCYKWYNTDVKGNTLPFYCPNFKDDKVLISKNVTSILPRLDNWKRIRDNYKKQYEDRLKPNGSEDEEVKNKRIQDKHYFKMHYDYWKDKVERFEAEEIKDSWVRRQLVDTQMISKYAREFLKTYFPKVAVQKGNVTAIFRKIHGFQPEEEIKNRGKHTHHAIDALVLTLIPTNSSKREKLLKEYFEILERDVKEELRKFLERERPISFNAQKFIHEIEESTLIFNYENDKITLQTKKIVRKRGEKQYLKDKNGKYRKDKEGNKILKIAEGDTIRSGLYAQTYLGKIKNVERDGNGFPKRENGDWKYEQGKDEFVFVVRKPIKDVLSKIDDIIDPKIRELIRQQKNNDEIRDFQGNVIRHVRIKTKAGKEVKERVNYRSEYDYKNKFYSESGSIPYAILLQKGNREKHLTKEGAIPKEKVERKMIPVSSFEIAKILKKYREFDIDQYIEFKINEGEVPSEFLNYPDKVLLKVGQKVFVLKSDDEFGKIKNIEFQTNRLYRITQFKYDGSKIMLQHHLEAQSSSNIDDNIKQIKDEIVAKIEKELNISFVTVNLNIIDIQERRKDYEKRKYDFANRLKIIENNSDFNTAKLIKEKIEQYKTESSCIVVEGQTPILGLSKSNWIFLYENVDFKMNMDGTIEYYF